MKQVSLYLTILFLCVFVLKNEAQTIQEISPANAGSSALEIKNMYGAAINLSDAEIRDFYFSHWTTKPYSSSCTLPDAEVTDVNNTSVSFDWLDTGSESYRVRYLSLSDGSTGASTTTEDSISINLDNDLYLFTFQSKCGDFSSALSIIIIEKPILFDYLTNCNCPRYSLLWNSSFDADNPAVYDWPFFNTTKTFYVEVEYVNSPDASFVADIEFGDAGPEEVSLSQACMTNVGLNADGTQLLAFNGSITQGVFGFSHELNIEDGEEAATQLSFSASETATESIGKLYLYQCKYKVDNRNSFASEEVPSVLKQPELSILNNPTRDFATIVYQLPETTSVSLTLFNVNGETVQEIKDFETTEKGTHRLPINLSRVQSGVYYCILKTPTITKSIRLIKI